jgi:hypothetical protein
MGLGPIEVLVVEFPGNRFNGQILPELEKLVEAGTITIVDGLLARREGGGEVTIVEFDQTGADEDAARLSSLMEQLESLISDDDVNELVAGLPPNSSAAILAFEHTWAKPFRDAILASGGVLAADFRVPGLVVQQLLDELAALPD